MGNEGKTVNIKLKEDKKRGAFGKADAGTNFNNLHDAKLLYNRFIGKKVNKTSLQQQLEKVMKEWGKYGVKMIFNFII